MAEPPRRPSPSLVDARELGGGRGREPRGHESVEDAVRRLEARVAELEPAALESQRFVLQTRAKESYIQSMSPPGGMRAVKPEEEKHSAPPKDASTYERVLRLAGAKAWVILLVVGSIVAIGNYAPELAVVIHAFMGHSAEEDHAAILAHTKDLDDHRRETAALRGYLERLRAHACQLQNDQGQVLSKLGAEWRMSGDCPPATVVEFGTNIKPSGSVTKGPWFVVKTPMPTPPKVPEARP